jgi:phosphoribosylamine--glycine ligase
MHRATVLIIGSGGREHALAWALARSPQVRQVYVAPGNAGTNWAETPAQAAAQSVPVAAEDTAALIDFAREQHIDLAVVGPEALLAVGIVDAFQAAGLPIFGPTRAATQLESSKVFAKEIMQASGISTANFALFTDFEHVRRHLDQQRASNAPVPVVKADGLAAGKGVLLCDTLDDVEAAARRMLVEREFGAAGEQIILEERLSGREVSLLAFSDGRTVVPMPPARDHKRIFDDDQGPNTGGMGAYAPAPDIDAAMVADLTRRVLQPVVDRMAAQGMPYVGVLYAGLIMTGQGVQVLEFNCRFGDPEAQAILPLLATGEGNASLYEILHACVEGRLDRLRVAWQPGTCATIVAVSPGYPGSYPKGLPIGGLEQLALRDDILVFHAGTTHQKNGRIVTAGGRVLNISATGADLRDALNRAYSAMPTVQFEGIHYRRDIGQRDLNPGNDL